MDNSWTVVTDVEERTPYAFKDNQWMGYDDIDSVIKTVRALSLFLCPSLKFA